MAAIGKIRSWGPVLVCVIGLALFAFIAEEAFRSCEATNNQARQQVGEVLGDKLSVQDFQTLVDEYQDIVKMTQGRDNLTEDELNNLKDQVWQQFVNNKILEKEAAKLGLTVTDEELQNILKEGTNPMLMQTPFVNQQTGRFDVSLLTKFLSDYKKMTAANNPQAEQYQTMYKYWQFMEKNLRQQTLATKYQTLLSHCLLSNPVSAKMAFDAKNQESNIILASAAYSTINDNDVKVSDADLKAKYEEQKEMFKQFAESRDIKYVDFQVLPSANDRAALMKTMKEASEKLQNGEAAAEVVRKAQSQFAYAAMPMSRRAYPSDIAAKLDSMAVGQTTAPFENKGDNTLNVVKLLAKTLMPDSIEYRQIQVGGETAEAAHKTADSIYTALKDGADFEALAKKYGQEGKSVWLTSNMYENGVIDADSKNYINALTTLGAGEMKNIEFTQGNIIVQVLNRKAMVDKYDAAVIKHTIDFSKDTYSQAYNKFSQFVSENKTLEDIEKNAAKNGYTVQERRDLFNNEHHVAGIRSTRETMKWIFDAKVGEVSPLYECGTNDHLLVVALTKVHPVGYRDLADAKEMVKMDVIRDKKFEMLKEKFAGVKSIADAKAKGAQIDSVNQVTFAAPAFIAATGASEPALSGAVAAAKEGQFSANLVKGNGGAYLFQVVKKNTRQGEKYDEKAMEQQLQQRALQAASRFMGELYQKANVVDNRYLFF